ncbi:hypothetical protein HMPREF0239_03108 [Clostridium sp. ATCC BAA-442]|nr:hypothetical protein HMPREF0239_03108 [Clostridium sp. ATCC BAA-442]
MHKTADKILSLFNNVLPPGAIRHIDCFYGRTEYRAGKPRPGEKEG